MNYYFRKLRYWRDRDHRHCCVVTFRWKEIPELMKGIGKGVKNFKDGVKGLEDDIKLDDTEKK